MMKKNHLIELNRILDAGLIEFMQLSTAKKLVRDIRADNITIVRNPELLKARRAAGVWRGNKEGGGEIIIGKRADKTTMETIAHEYGHGIDWKNGMGVTGSPIHKRSKRTFQDSDHKIEKNDPNYRGNDDYTRRRKLQEKPDDHISYDEITRSRRLAYRDQAEKNRANKIERSQGKATSLWLKKNGTKKDLEDFRKQEVPARMINRQDSATIRKDVRQRLDRADRAEVRAFVQEKGDRSPADHRSLLRNIREKEIKERNRRKN